ncbi:tetratricopeptide repeat protein [Pontibacter sp. JH31]|uniref:Tetratricopeptide repeat protein n=1 Tax=Pontibacter aquaedesilientis TaxID=2766980 RepID=A0ABR7XBZ9_9BACT|nr:DUF6340 family protein [Pontibacter aquaedesilientis]MBD1395829.1 tetratricopeptide repeat protein [Pontibacter aquaedesilientis]
MKLSRIRAVLCSLLALQLSSCVTLLTLETVQPPAVQVTHNQWKILVVNRYDASQASNKNERVIEVFRDGANQAAGGAMGAVYNDSTFVLINPDSAIVLPSSATAQLGQEEVRRLFAKYSPHLILTLDQFDARMKKQVDTYEDEEGSRTKIANYNLLVRTSWTLYDSTGTVIDQADLMHDDFYDSRTAISGLLAIGPAIAKAGPAINRLAVEAGYSYWDRLYPKPMLLVRQVHSTQALSESAAYIHTNRWQQAIDLLLPMAQDARYKHRKKAAHNLAVAYEGAGNYEQAIYWAMQAAGQGDKCSALLLEAWEEAGIFK